MLFNEKENEIDVCIKNGNIKSLQKILIDERNRQKPDILPEAVEILEKYHNTLLENCRRRNNLINPKIPFLEKIHSIAIGEFSIKSVPHANDTKVNEKKNFLVLFRNDYQFELIIQVLSEAGWGGSLIIGLYNFSSIHEILDTKQIDFIIKSDLGSEYDLYKEEFQSRNDVGNFIGNIISCCISDQKLIQKYALDLVNEKIQKHILTKVKLSEEV